MGRSSSTASSPTVCGTKLNAYPPVRVATHHYASSETTLADSLPSSPQYQPPPYADEAQSWPPEYHDEFLEREKRHWEPLPKKTLVVRLCTSVFIAFIVCLIVAAVSTEHIYALDPNLDRDGSDDKVGDGKGHNNGLQQHREADRYECCYIQLPIHWGLCQQRKGKVQQ
ncbi:hypothetical protein ISF_01393 [Cordyceps fumosorosea ARSEF 2679]|uniref:Uncharacterized protein n=1 Tax=Cordyceps fumosorosea (strain ARSEF 2679) TaxID=1081104 RepID=A0A168D9E2_CORFA|nr:hypothetical protein ISF_01393 [Cordyceps fumosorosea ARSEF 2679]OAA72320.1 hypothetical protein ISF_01393 [Cordyceps fumosorosea ARSEF 2679]